MSEKSPGKLILVAVIIVAALALATIVIWMVNRQAQSTSSSENIDQPAPLTSRQRREMQSYAAPGITPGATLKEIGDAARTWAPGLPQWYGQDAPDFTLTDTEGKEHRLSDYKGRNVIVVFWATWCPPCKMEIPHLILLEKRMSPDDLKILAITNENPELVRKFVAKYGINYTVLLDTGSMPSFYMAVPAKGIPSAAFIDPQGKIKFVTSGYIPLEDTRAILAAPQ